MSQETKLSCSVIICDLDRTEDSVWCDFHYRNFLDDSDPLVTESGKCLYARCKKSLSGKTYSNVCSGHLIELLSVLPDADECIMSTCDSEPGIAGFCDKHFRV